MRAAGFWLALGLIVTGPLLGAQEASAPIASGEDPFAAGEDPFAAGAFEAAAGPSTGAEGSGLPRARAGAGAGAGASAGAESRIDYLLGGSFSVSASAWAGLGKEGYAASSAASGKLFAKVGVPERGSLYASYSLRQAFLKARTGDLNPSLVRAESLDEPSLALSELHYSFDLGKRVFLRLGKQLAAWGPSFVWTPVDFVNAERADAFASVDTRAGTSGLKLTVPLGAANVVAFMDLSGTVDAAGALAADPAEVLTWAGRVDAVLGGFEWGLSGFWGAGSQAKAGLDLSGYLFGTTVYAELAAAPEREDDEAFMQAALGFSRSLGDLKKWTLSGEGFYNSTGGKLDAAALETGYANGSLKPLYAGRAYAYLSLKAQDLLFSGHDATLSSIANLSDRSYEARLLQDFDLKGVPPFSLALAYRGGGEGREFTLLGDSLLELSLRSKLEF